MNPLIDDTIIAHLYYLVIGKIVPILCQISAVSKKEKRQAQNACRFLNYCKSIADLSIAKI